MDKIIHRSELDLELARIRSGGGGSGSATWGSITGDIDNQTDLKAILEEKADSSDIPVVPTNVSEFTNDAGYITSETDPTVPSWAKASSKPAYTASEVGAVPTSRKVNGKALSADISLTASDVGALPDSTVIPSVVDTYSSTGTQAVSGKAVNAALKTLDSSISATTGQAISAITITNGKIVSSSKVSVGETNQNAFSNVKVGSSTISADSSTDTLELSAGSNVTLTADTTNDKVTIAASQPTKVSQLENDSGFTTNTGTITGIKMNGASKGSSGVVDLGTVIIAHQDISGKVDKVTGKGLSTNDYTTAEKTKLEGIATEATKVTESTVSGWGFTKNTGTYSKPSSGIPKSDLASAVQTSLGKADTALQSHQDISGKQDKITAITAQTTQAVYPIKIDSQGHITAYGSAVTIPAAVRVKGNSESSYRTGDVNLTAANIGAAASSHAHGNITSGGDITTTATIASGDRLVINDESASKVTNSSITFGTSTTTFLRNDGTWATAGGGSASTITENTQFNISGTSFYIELVS